MKSQTMSRGCARGGSVCMKEAKIESTQNYIISRYEGYSSIITVKPGTGFLECLFASLIHNKNEKRSA